MKQQIRCKIKGLVIALDKPANWLSESRGGGKDAWKNGTSSYDRLPFEVSDFLENEFLSPNSRRVYFSISRQTIEDIKTICTSIFYIAIIGALFFSLYINMVQIPQCQNKGFADVDSKGCFLIKDGEKIYE